MKYWYCATEGKGTAGLSAIGLCFLAVSGSGAVAGLISVAAWSVLAFSKSLTQRSIGSG